MADELDRSTNKYVALNPTAYAIVCGLVQPDDVVDSAAIVAKPEVWDLLRRKFPFDHFRDAVDLGLIGYEYEEEVP